MAAPHRGYRAPYREVPPADAPQRREAPAHPGRRRSAHPLRRQARVRRFFALVVVPVLLMLGSVYLNTVSAGLSARSAALEEKSSRLEAQREELEVRVARLSAPDRIRALAREDLGMRDPGGANLRVYGGNREDGTESAGEENREGPR